MNIKYIFLCIFLSYLAGFAAHSALLHKTVYGDGIYYYSWVRSSVVDRDINFSNEYAHFGVSQPKTALGEYGNKYSIGASILWYPWFLWTHTILKGTGYELLYQLVVGLASLLYGFVGLVLLFRLLSLNFSRQAVIISMLAVALASNLLFYGSLDTANSHAVSFFASTLFLTLLLDKKKQWFKIGCALGLIALIRSQDAILGLLALLYIKPKQLFQYIAGAIYICIPQLLAWQILYGKFWSSPYISSIEGFHFTNPQVLGVLFSLSNGLVSWTPIVGIGFIGLLLRRKNALLYKMMALICFIHLYIVSSWSIWWQGASYSGRMFVSMLPLLSFGVANVFSIFLSTQPKKSFALIGIISPLIFINMCLILFFLIKN